MKKFLIAASPFLFLLAACSGGGSNNVKRVIVMASGKLTVTDKTIQLDPSLSHNEQELLFKDDKLTLTVKSTAGTNKTFDLTDNGVYVLNLQSDTLIGGMINYGESGRPGRITAEQLDRIIDSTQKLIVGANVSDAKNTYFVVPFSIKKVSTKTNTKVVGTFKGIPYNNAPDETGTVPDVIKFFTAKEKRQTLRDLEAQKKLI